jgi:hypothetical protein
MENRMLASEFVEMIKTAIEKHGDLPIVSGVNRTGYGESVVSVNHVPNTIDIDEKLTPVLDIRLHEESLVTLGSW